MEKFEKVVSAKNKEISEEIEIFNKKGKLSDEDLEKAKIFLKDEAIADKILNEYYHHLLKRAKKSAGRDELEQLKDVARGAGNSFKIAYDQFQDLQELEKFLDFDVRRYMLSHYEDDKRFKYDLGHLFVISLLEGFTNWLEESGEPDLKKVNINILKNNAKLVEDEDMFASALAVLMETLDLYFDLIEADAEAQEKRDKFLENPGQFIEEKMSDLPFDELLIKRMKSEGERNRIGKEIYESLKNKGYISRELPSYDEILKAVPDFPIVLVNTLEEFKNNEFKLSVLGIASLYTAIMNAIYNAPNGEEYRRDAEKIQEHIDDLVNKNGIDQKDPDYSKEVFELLNRASNPDRKKTKSSNLNYI